MPLRSSYTGKEVAEQMLRENSRYDVRGLLFNEALQIATILPTKRQSKSSDKSVKALPPLPPYCWFSMRSAVVPLVKFGGSIVPRLLLGGGLMFKAFSNAAFGVVAENKYYNPGRTTKS
jgi:Zn-dependent membrane protease YugP